MVKKDKKKMIVIAAVILIAVLAFAFYQGAISIGPKFEVTLSLGNLLEGRQSKVTYGGSSILNYVKTLGVSITIANTGTADLTNIRVTAASPAELFTACSGQTIAQLNAGAAPATITCQMTEAQLAALETKGELPWSVTLTARDEYRGTDMTPVSSAPLQVLIQSDLIGSYTVDMGVSKQG